MGFTRKVCRRINIVVGAGKQFRPYNKRFRGGQIQTSS